MFVVSSLQYSGCDFGVCVCVCAHMYACLFVVMYDVMCVACMFACTYAFVSVLLNVHVTNVWRMFSCWGIGRGSPDLEAVLDCIKRNSIWRVSN